MSSLLSRPLIESFRFGDDIVGLVTDDLSEEQAHFRSRAGTGPSIAWTLGHLCQYRSTLLGLLERPADTTVAEVFDRSATPGDDYPPVAELREEFRRLGGLVAQALSDVPDDRYLESVEGDVHGASSLLERLMFFPWHEAAHLGQLSGLRKEQGLPGTAELVMARHAAASE